MKPMTIDDMIAVLQAAKVGKAIETRSDWADDGAWVDTWDFPQKWNFSIREYRVKSEPEDYWAAARVIYDSEHKARVAAEINGCDVIHLRRVP